MQFQRARASHLKVPNKEGNHFLSSQIYSKLRHKYICHIQTDHVQI